MKRSLVELGKNCLVTSLPASWIKKNDLKKGDEVEIEESENTLIVSRKSPKTSKKITLNLEDTKILFGRVLSAVYKVGYDEVHIKLNKKNNNQEIKDILQKYFIGYEIVEQNPESIVIKLISETIEQELEKILQRCFFIVKSMSEELVKGIKQKDKETIKSLILSEELINRFSIYCRRVLLKDGWKEYKKTPLYYCIVEEIEKVSDNYRDLSIFLTKNNKIDVNKNTESMLTNASSLIGSYVKTFYSYSLKDNLSLFEEAENLKKKTNKLIEEKKDIFILTTSLEIISHITNLSSLLLSASIESTEKTRESSEKQLA